MRPNWLCVVVACLFLAPAMLAQSPASENQSAASPAQLVSTAEVPRLVKFSGTLLDAQDQPLAGPVGVTFALYAQQSGSAALWLETQNVKPDASGTYTVLLGANSAKGVPAELFVSGEARWLGIQVGQEAEHERILLVSVPYALKAGDAQTLGGKPASAYLTTETLTSAGNSAAAATATAASSTPGALPKSSAATTPKKAAPTPQATCPNVTSDGTATVNSIAKFTAACAVQNSAITEIAGNVGIGTTTPAAALHVNGDTLLVTSATTAQVQFSGSASSARFGQDASGAFFASDSPGKAVRFYTNNGTLNEGLRVTSAGNVGIGIPTPAAKLDVAGNINSSGSVTATSFTGSGSGLTSLNAGNLASSTVPSAAISGTYSNAVTFTNAGNSLTGNGSGLTNVNAALLNGLASSAFQPAGSYATRGANSFNGTQTITNGGLALPNTTGCCLGAITLGGKPFLHNFGGGNTFVGENAGGGFAESGGNNTALGITALYGDRSGGENTALGWGALIVNDSGSNNTAVGSQSLYVNRSGSHNTAVGFGTGTVGGVTGGNISGSNNTFVGYDATPGGNLQNASAIGANAFVSQSNALVLGSINGVNGATSSVNVGIGTSTPQAALDIATGGGIRLSLTDAGSTNNQIFFQDNGQIVSHDPNHRIFFDRTNNVMWFLEYGNVLFSPGLGGAGGVGIGTLAPDNLLTVNGTADKPGGGSWGTFSDGRLKDVAGAYQAGLEEILKLHPIRYRYKEQNALGIKDIEEHVGFVAQDVEKIIPEAVSRDAKGYRILNNDPILWSMLNAIKEQQGEITALRGRAQKQDRDVQTLKQQNAQLRQQLLAISDQVKQIRNQVEAASAKPENAARDSGSGASATNR